MKFKHILFLAVLLISLSGCTIVKISSEGVVPVFLNRPPEVRFEVIEDLNVSKQIMFNYTGCYDISEIVSSATDGKKADAIINCQITVRVTAVDCLLNYFTLGIVYSRTIEVTGQLVRFPDGMGNLSLEKRQIIDVYLVDNSVNSGIILLNN